MQEYLFSYMLQGRIAWVVSKALLEAEKEGIPRKQAERVICQILQAVKEGLPELKSHQIVKKG